MKINKVTHKVNAQIPHLDGSNYLANRIGFWGIVSAQDSKTNTVTVISDTGYEYQNVPGVSNEWVTVDDNKDYIPSTRNLPPKNSRVFVLTPTFSGSGAFVLCSGFSRGDENIRTLWAQSDSEVEEKNNSRETKTQGGWDITENYANGNSSYTSNDENIKLEVQVIDDSEDSSKKKKIELTAWENRIKIDADGITITDDNGNVIERTSDGIKVTDTNDNKIEMNSDGISVTDDNNNKVEMTNGGITIKDKNNNKIEMASGGITVTDKNNNKIEMKSGEVIITGSATNKIKIGNSAKTLKGLFDDLVTVLNSFQTAGSPANHVAVPGQFAAFSMTLSSLLE